MNPQQIAGLILVFVAFCVLMGLILRYCQRERARALQGNDGGAEKPVALLISGIIASGAALAIITAYLVFFRNWG